MINIILNIIGVIIIIYAMISLRRDSKREVEVNKTNEKDELIENFKMVLEDKMKESPQNLDYQVSDEAREEIYKPTSEEEISELEKHLLKDFNKENKYKSYETYNNVKPQSLVRDIKTKVIDENVSEENRKILELDNIGLSKGEIAKQTSRSVREVEVILKVHGRV